MKIEMDTHSHTIVSGHAYNTIREMAKRAADKGLRALAITEHAPELPGTCHIYYFQNLKVVPRHMYGIDVWMGVELNIMDEDGHVDLPADLIRELDISIASMHTPCYQAARTIEGVTRAYVNAMHRAEIDIIGHPDDGRFPVEYETLVKEAKATGTLLEVNNSSLKPGGFRENTVENTKKMLAYCIKYGAMIVLGTDSHVDETIAEYESAMRVLGELDFPEELVANTTVKKLKASLKRNKKV